MWDGIALRTLNEDRSTQLLQQELFNDLRNNGLTLNMVAEFLRSPKKDELAQKIVALLRTETL